MSSPALQLRVDGLFQREATTRRITDGVVSNSGHNVRASLELETRWPPSETFLIQDLEATSLAASARHDRSRGIPTSEPGWTVEKAMAIRQGLASWAEDWDDPALDVYNVYLQG